MEEILQKTLVEAKDRNGFAVLDDTVAKTMTQVMEIRESLLDRIKMIRKEEIYVDPDQNIRQEEMLADFRMSVMEILLKLVDKDAAYFGRVWSAAGARSHRRACAWCPCAADATARVCKGAVMRSTCRSPSRRRSATTRLQRTRGGARASAAAARPRFGAHSL